MGKLTIKDIVLETYKNTKPITKEDFISELKQQFNSVEKKYVATSVNAAIRKCNLKFIEKGDQQSPDNNKTQTINRMGKTYRRSPKGRDKIHGRSSDAVIQARQNCCTNLYNKKPDYWRNVKVIFFLPEYKKELKKMKINIPTDNTLRDDIKKLGLTFKGTRGAIPPPTYSQVLLNNFEKLGEDFGQYISQIRIVCKNHDKVLYDSESSKPIDNKKDFFKPLNKIKNAYKVVNDPEKEQTVKKTIFRNTLVHLYFIMKIKGLEGYFAEKFDNASIEKDFLFIEIHDYCVKIVFEYKNLSSIKDKIWIIAYAIPE